MGFTISGEFSREKVHNVDAHSSAQQRSEAKLLCHQKRKPAAPDGI